MERLEKLGNCFGTHSLGWNRIVSKWLSLVSICIIKWAIIRINYLEGYINNNDNRL